MFKIGILSQTSAPVPPPPITANWSDIEGNDSTALYTYTSQQVTPAPATGKLTIQYNNILARVYAFVSPTNFLSSASGTPPSSILIDGVTNMVYVAPGDFILVNDLDYVTFGVEIFSQAVPAQSAIELVTVYDDATFIDSFSVTVNSIASDVTPDAVNWSDITFDPTTNPSITRQYTTQQINGINTLIELSITSSSAEVSTLWYRVSPLAPPTFSSSLVLFDNNSEGFVRWVPGVNITVNNGSYITFTANGPSIGLSTTVFNIRNASNNNVLLDSFTATTLSKLNFSAGWTSVSAQFPAYVGQGFSKTFASQIIPANSLGTSGASITVKNTDVVEADIYYSTTAIGPFNELLDVTTDPNWTLVPFGATGSTFTVFTGTTVSFTTVPVVNAVTNGQFYVYNNSLGGTLVNTVQVSLVQGPDYTPNTVSWGNYSTNQSILDPWIYTSSAQITGINQPITLSANPIPTNPAVFGTNTLVVWYAVTAAPLVAGIDYNAASSPALQSPPFNVYTGPITVTNGQYVTWFLDWGSYPTNTVSTNINLNINNNTTSTLLANTVITFAAVTSINASFANVNQDQVIPNFTSPSWLYSSNLISGSGGPFTLQIQHNAPSYVQLYYRVSATNTLPPSNNNPTATSPLFIAINSGGTISVAIGQYLQFAVSYTSTTGEVVNFGGYVITVNSVTTNTTLGTFTAFVYPDNNSANAVIASTASINKTPYPNQLGPGIDGYKRAAAIVRLSLKSGTTFNYPFNVYSVINFTGQIQLYYRIYTGTASPAFDPFLDPATVPYYTRLLSGSFTFVNGVLTINNRVLGLDTYFNNASLPADLFIEIVPTSSVYPISATSFSSNGSVKKTYVTPSGVAEQATTCTTQLQNVADVIPNTINFNDIIIGNQVDGKYGFTQVLQVKDVTNTLNWSIETYSSSAGFTVFYKYSLTPFTITSTTHPGNQGFVRIATDNVIPGASIFTPSASYPAFTYPADTLVTTPVQNGMYMAIAIVQDIQLGGSTTLTVNNQSGGNVTLDTFSVTWNTAFAGSDPNPGTTSFNNPTNNY